MAPTKVTKAGDNDKNIVKMPRLPKNARIQKRPILHPAIPSPFTGADQQKIVYVSTKMPFISAVKRVRKLLCEIDKRSMGKIDLVDGKGSDKQKLRKLGERPHVSAGKQPEEVILKATSRAIQNVLGLALFFQGQDDCRVRLRTGTVGVVDDIVESVAPAGDKAVEGENEEEELPESRVRKASFVEVAITLK
ncbi:Rpp20 subunit of nuclear RNase MRP and P-domain-containing protein [Usnea florida]